MYPCYHPNSKGMTLALICPITAGGRCFFGKHRSRVEDKSCLSAKVLSAADTFSLIAENRIFDARSMRFQVF